MDTTGYAYNTITSRYWDGKAFAAETYQSALVIEAGDVPRLRLLWDNVGFDSEAETYNRAYRETDPLFT